MAISYGGAAGQTGGPAAFSGPGFSGVGYGRGGVGPGAPASWGGTGPAAINTFAEAQLATIAKAKAQAKALGPDGQPLTNWGDAVTAEGMQAIVQAGKDAYVKNAFDNFMDSAALRFAKYSPMLNLAEGANYLFGGQPTANPVTALGQYLYSSPSTTQSLSSGIASLVGTGQGQNSGAPQGGLGSLSGMVTGHADGPILEEAPVFSPAAVPSQPRSTLQPAFQLSEAALNPFLISPGSDILQASIF